MTNVYGTTYEVFMVGWNTKSLEFPNTPYKSNTSVMFKVLVNQVFIFI